MQPGATRHSASADNLTAADAQDALATVSAEAKTKTDPMAALESKYLELVSTVMCASHALMPEVVSGPSTAAEES